MRRFYSRFPLETTRLPTVVGAALFILTLSFLPPYTSLALAGKVVFHDCDFLELRGRDAAHVGLFPISGEPAKGVMQDISGTLFGTISSANFRFATPSGKLIENITMELPPNAHPHETDYYGEVVPPDEPFRLAVSGLDANGKAFDLTCKKTFNSQPVTVKIKRDPFEIKAGTTTYFPRVTNFGPADTFDFNVINKDGYVSRVSTTNFILDSGESQTVEVDITVPAEVNNGDKVIIKAIATSATNSDNSNFAVMEVGVIVPAEIIPPPDIVLEATGPLTPVDLGTPITTDNEGVTDVFSNAPVSFRVGEFTVTWTALDADGNVSRAPQSVIIKDTTPPSLTAPADITTQATGEITAVDVGIPSASDIAGDVLVTNDAPEAGFPVGETTVTWVATDDSGNSTSDTQTVTLTPPNPAGR